MNKKTERRLLDITRDVARLCGMDSAIKEIPDPNQIENKKKAKEILFRTRLPNDWSPEECITIAKQMNDVIDEPVRMIKDVDPEKQKAYNVLLTARIKNAIKSGELPDPTKDKQIIKMMKLHKK